MDDVLAYLLEASHEARGDDLAALVQQAAVRLGAVSTEIYVADYQQDKLMPFGHLGTAGHEDSEPGLSIERTLGGRAYREVTDQRSEGAGHIELWLPLVNGTERLGVLQLRLARPNDGPSDWQPFATLISELILSRRFYSDALEITRRRLPMSVAAESQWALLPPLTCRTGRVVISGILEPAYEVGGDVFDYAVNGETAHLAVLDAVGHGLQASLLSSAALSALRNARRSGLSLVDTVRSMDKWVSSEFGPEAFLTGIVAELDCARGTYRWICAGHPPALLIRHCQIVKHLEGPPGLPIGLNMGVPEPMEERLEPGDRLLLYTDGVIEARDGNGEFFGLERLADFVAKVSSAERPAPETMRQLSRAIVDHHGDNLQDDATTLLLEWLGPAGAADAAGHDAGEPVRLGQTEHNRNCNIRRATLATDGPNTSASTRAPDVVAQRAKPSLA
ncbi:MAG: PP2C family protein-serine/threonine phosphatase [Nocardioidaceae bacterium]